MCVCLCFPQIFTSQTLVFATIECSGKGKAFPQQPSALDAQGGRRQHRGFLSALSHFEPVYFRNFVLTAAMPVIAIK
jgi:hypothetical protein